MQTEDDANFIIGKRHEVCESGKSKFGPFVMFIGDLVSDGNVQLEPHAQAETVNIPESVLDIPQVRLYLDKDYFLNVPSNSLLDAVDSCFKSMILLKIPFPAEVKNVWTFFQLHFYNFELKNAYKYNSITYLCKNLGD